MCPSASKVIVGSYDVHFIMHSSRMRNGQVLYYLVPFLALMFSLFLFPFVWNLHSLTVSQDASCVSYLFGVDASALEPSPLVKDPNVRGLVWERSLEALRDYLYIS